MNYEGKKKDDTNDIAHFFKKLLIDVPQNLFLNINITNKLFLIQLGYFQNIESANIIIIQANNAFKHQIISADTTILLINLTPYSFTTSTNI